MNYGNEIPYRVIKYRCPRKLKKWLKKRIYLETPPINAYRFQIRETKSLLYNGCKIFSKVL